MCVRPLQHAILADCDRQQNRITERRAFGLNHDPKRRRLPLPLPHGLDMRRPLTALTASALLVSACAGTPHGAVRDDADTGLIAEDTGADSPDTDLPDADAASPDADADDTPDVPDDGLFHMPRRAACQSTWRAPTATAPVTDPALIEASGLVVSPTHDGVIWSHNDSGDTARLFALDTSGRALGQVHLQGVTAIDFEDLAAAPCPDRLRACLWVADIGNNSLDRTDLAIYVVPEPDVDARTPFGELTVAPIARIPIRYDDGLLNAEAFVVLPDASAFYILEKVDEPRARIFVAEGPFTDGGAHVMRSLTTFASPGFGIAHGYEVTGADLHTDGTRMAVRLYLGSFEYRLGAGQSWADLGAIQPAQIAAGPLTERQGEAITYDQAGPGLFTLSEDADRDGEESLHHYDCVD